MVRYRIAGGSPLGGTAFVQGAKNAALPMIAASLLAERGQTVLHNVPPIDDVRAAVELARAVGASVEFHEPERTVVVDASGLSNPVLPAPIASRFRGSVLFLPPLLARLGEAVLEGIGGCRIGSRNLDFHYRGFVRLGAEVTEEGETIRVRRHRRLRGAAMYLDTPSHTGTENLMMAAALAEGPSVIENAAQEPEVADVARFLAAMGARIAGVGTGFIHVEGVERLRAVEYTIIPDRIDAGVLAMAVAATGGDAGLVNARLEHLGVALRKLEQMGVELSQDGAVVRVRRTGRLRPINVLTAPYPGFATDLQAPMTTLATQAEGTSYLRETIFDGRFAIVGELARLGADIEVDGDAIVTHGPSKLGAGEVVAHDLRTGSALVLAGLVAEGTVEVSAGEMIERGHAELAGRLRSLGASVERITVP